MLVDLIQVTTRDGVRLDGMLQAPGAGLSAGVTALVCVHGTGGNFYSSTLFQAFAEHFVALGCAVLRVNTRGHDGISTAVTAQGGRRLGAAYEAVDDCRHDLAAWIDWAAERAGPRLVLVGHSLGAVKSQYTLAQEAHPAVVALVALSPPRLAYSVFRASPTGQEFLDTYAAAESRVRAGQPDALLDVRLPIPYVITASGYVEKYGPDERYNFLKFVGRVPCRMLVTYGGAELTNMAFGGVPEALAPIAAEHGRLAIETVPGGDHFYSGVRPELITRVDRWLRSGVE